MFKRLVSSLPFSPALIGQLGFYARRLQKEEATRRLGLVFTALAIAVQSFAVFNPPEAQAIASPQNVVFQGVRSKADFLKIYDANADSAGHRDIQQIFTHFGITRADIARSHEGTFNSRDFNLGLWSVGRNSYDAGTKYEQAHKVEGASSTVYARKLWRFDKLPYTQRNGSTYRGLVGQRTDGSWFSVSFDCGNLAYTKPKTATTARLLSTTSEFKLQKGVANLTQNKDDANGSTAEPGDRLVYTLSAKNMGGGPAEYRMQEELADVLEYADVLDVDGAVIEKDSEGKTTGTIIWPREAVAASSSLTKSITVQVKDSVPATPQNVGNPESYNCTMTNSFGSTTNVNVDCPPTKLAENTVKQLPSTGPGENMLFGGILLMTVTYFYVRSRLLKKEARLVRREFASGAL